MNPNQLKIAKNNKFFILSFTLFISACSSSQFAESFQSAWQSPEELQGKSQAQTKSQPTSLNIENSEALYQQLAQTKDYLAFARQYPSLSNSVVLYNASILSMQNNNAADAFFYYEVANARTAYDLETCLPVPKPAQIKLQELFVKAEKALNLFAKPFDSNKVLKQFKAWELLTHKGYQPSWDCQYNVLLKDKREVANRVKKIKLSVLEKVVILLNDSHYMRAATNALAYLNLPEVEKTLLKQNQYKRNRRLIIAKEAQVGTGLVGSKLP